jgi:outer membrane immunogenic protein
MSWRAFAGGLAVAAGAAISICSAGAADLPIPTKAPPPTAPVAYAPEAVYNWTGFYIGGNVGAGFGNSSWTDPATGGNNAFNDRLGFLGGGQVGANYQWNHLVLGVEGDFDWAKGMGLSGSSLDSAGNNINTGVNFTSTVTGRIGAAFDRLLVYGKGGLAVAQDNSTFTDVFGNSASDTFMRTGWTAGGGFEYALGRNWTARIEYDYLGFAPQTVSFSTPTTPAYTSSASLNVQEVKAGLNFKFGGP